MSDHTSRVIAEIAAERQQRAEAKGWNAEHDDDHVGGTLARAAAVYAAAASIETFKAENPGAHFFPSAVYYANSYVERGWPWDGRAGESKDPRRDLIRAAALIVAEIERLDRAAS